MLGFGPNADFPLAGLNLAAPNGMIFRFIGTGYTRLPLESVAFSSISNVSTLITNMSWTETHNCDNDRNVDSDRGN